MRKLLIPVIAAIAFAIVTVGCSTTPDTTASTPHPLRYCAKCPEPGQVAGPSTNRADMERAVMVHNETNQHKGNGAAVRVCP
jgi:hypothetical protein